ncbi:P-loop containing nucleoside triphosphate hydrolase protein [Meira miltonrushii]|uniref:RNA helicase n=1 Tax=Meira miltonrushii TaxID=1280837 RepID=A0A316VCT1_9BASI|nr:P-loop containing nucleoside triphosphate hydrolase protein [Meira miltonrushii]PWN33801.1 P-loop containing nucleoside triphosphate hydrolase protein [Meira miltonrushii]
MKRQHSSSSLLHGEGSSNGIQNYRSHVDPRITESRTKLPIWIARDAIVDAVKENDTVVILGETGSGKTTQIPQFLFDGGLSSYNSITQPRRVAAISLAKRVAVEMGVPEPDNQNKQSAPGSGNNPALVGYSVRFDDRTSKQTRVKFMTDGWLLRELLAEQGQQEMTYSLLEQYSVIIIDEAHERSVHTDVVLGLIKQVQRERKRIRKEWLERTDEGNSTNEYEPTELKVIVMSATIDAESFANFFVDERSKPAPILYIKGRQYPVKLLHSENTCEDWIDSCKKVVVQISAMLPGDVLIFMTGAEEIESFASELRELDEGLQMYAEDNGKPKPLNLLVVKLYAALGGDAIRKCFSPTPPGSRKIVLATNIAETSITIPGISYVIDCGLAKERTFQSSMTGRAGRERAGTCFRLFTQLTFETLPESSVPEILRTDLSSVVLDVFAMGLDPLSFNWLDQPDSGDLTAAVLNLTELGALSTPSGPKKDGKFNLTDLGRRMSKLPLLPALSKTLLTACNFDDDGKVFWYALDLVSILSTERRTILLEASGGRSSENKEGKANQSKRDEADRARERLAHPSGDHATQLQALYAFDDMEESCRTQEWCNANYVSLKAVRETRKIRLQLLQVCRQQGWIPEAIEKQMTGEREDYSSLIKCLVQGKRVNAAFRDPQTSYYKRALGGQSKFRIHPSSTLLLSNNRGPAGLPNVIYFEDMIFTKDLYARTVSAAEASWLTDMSAQSKAN